MVGLDLDHAPRIHTQQRHDAVPHSQVLAAVVRVERHLLEPLPDGDVVRRDTDDANVVAHLLKRQVQARRTDALEFLDQVANRPLVRYGIVNCQPHSDALLSWK